MNKLLIVLLLGLVGCAHKPMLEPGSCYRMFLHSTVHADDPWSGSSSHNLASYKVIKIFKWNNHDYYAIQMLAIEWNKDESDLVPLYSKSKTYGYSYVKTFDQYIGINSGKFSPADNTQTVRCNPITDKDWADGAKSPRAPINRNQDDPTGFK